MGLEGTQAINKDCNLFFKGCLFEVSLALAAASAPLLRYLGLILLMLGDNYFLKVTHSFPELFSGVFDTAKLIT